MAGRAHATGVAVSDRELSVLGVIKRRVQPVRGAVAGRARRREELRLRGVPRIGRVVVVRLVAADASNGKRRVIIVDVAIGARPWRHRVRSG